MPLVCAKAPGKKTNPAIGSIGMGAAEDRRIPARWVPSGLGKGRDGTCVHIGLSSRGLDGSEQWPVRGSAAPGLGGRGEPCSGEQAGRPDQCAGGQAQGGEGKG
jgi:hypothetical protein